MMLIYIFGILAALVVLIYIYFKWVYSYWWRQNVPFEQATVPYGSVGIPKGDKRAVSLEINDVYNKMKSQGHKYAGIFLFDMPILIPIDIDLIKSILIRDFNHFVNRGFYYNEENDPLSAHIFSIEDDSWRNMRSRASPAFRSAKIKGMLDICNKYCEPLKESIEQHYIKREMIDVKDLFARYTIDLIACCAFGIEVNSFKNPNSEFVKHGRDSFKEGVNIWMLITMVFPKMSHFFNCKLVPKKISNFFLNVVESTIKYRKENNLTRNDFLQSLIDVKNDNSLNFNQIAATSYGMLLAGFESSSSLLTYCLYELSKQPKIQDKIRLEIKLLLKKHGGIITPEMMEELDYTDQVIKETMRMYPAALFLNRVCNNDYQIRGSDYVIKKGTKIFIPTYGIHRDPKYYPEPDLFNPERFAKENEFPSCVFSPFGEGPRMCIGLKFAWQLVKTVLVNVLNDYNFELNSKTPDKLTMDPNSLTMSFLEIIYIDVEKCSNNNNNFCK